MKQAAILGLYLPPTSPGPMVEKKTQIQTWDKNRQSIDGCRQHVNQIWNWVVT
ncbi:MAG: hypothetical protein M0Z37_02340 [Nitrospiraceae bacterium]|nr:hypothetical protein [Nitrospiraceae bacterium]